MNNQDFKEIPLVIGAVGHIDVIVSDSLIVDIKDKLGKIISKIDDNVPLILQSQLAKGADTLLAQIFMDLKNGYPNKNLQLYVPLPMPLSDYESDFSGDDLTIFRQLCEKATKVFELPDQINQGRDKCYEQGANYILNSSMLLMVLWDGIFNKKIGGTSETIKKIHYGSSKADIQLDNDLPMILWKVQRHSTSLPAVIDHELFEIYNYQNVVQHDTVVNIFKFLNKAQKLKSKVFNHQIETSINYLSMAGYCLNSLSDESKRIIDLFAINDAISIKEQSRYLFISKLVFILSFIVMFLFQFYEQFGLTPIITVLFASMMIVLYVYTKTFNVSMGDNNAFLQHRLIAETLRINFYLLCLGLSPTSHENSVIVHRESWVNRVAMSLIYLSTKNSNLAIEGCHNLININWLKNQQDYFDKKSVSIAKKIKLFDFFIKFISITIIILLLLTLISIFFGYEYLENLININFTFFLIFLITKTYYEFREYDNTLLQSRMMANIFAKYRAYIITHEDINDSIYVELANKALTELHLWYLVYRDKNPGLEV